MPSRPVQALLAVEPGVDAEDVKDSLPGSEDFQIVGVVTGADEALTWLRGGVADLLLVACAGYSDRALLLLDGVARQNPELNVMVLGHGSPNGFLRRAFEAGADDIVMLPATPEQIRFEIHKLMARKTSVDIAPQNEHSRAGLHPRAEGWDGQDAHVDKPLRLPRAARREGRAHRPRPPVRRRRPVPRPSAGEDGVRPRPVSRRARLGQAAGFMAHHSSGVQRSSRRDAPTRQAQSAAELLREIYSILRQNYDWVIVDTPPGFTAEVITSIDHSTDIVMVGMLDSLSLKNTKLGLETLELMKYDTDHIYLLLNRAHSRVGISQSDVEAVLGRTPDVFIPSDREIPRTVNEGIPIVVARPQSEPAEAFGRLTDLLTGESVSTAQHLAMAGVTDTSSSAAAPSRRRLFGRKG